MDYYRSVVKKMGAKDSEWLRAAVYGPRDGALRRRRGTEYVFGQGGVPRADAGHDLEAALEHWVEQGGAPEQVVASKMKAGSNPPAVVRTRPLCAYPADGEVEGEREHGRGG